jgi:hypothetical protein
MRPDTLCHYPYVVVRIACDACGRAGSYRLARLAERYGADIDLETLLDHLASGCKYRDFPQPQKFRCRARFRDLEPPRRPPDLPGRRLRVVSGGRDT